MKTLTEAARAADRAVMELRHRFDAEQQQIDRELEARLARLVQDNRLAVHAEIAKRLTSQPTRADALRLAQQVAEATIHSWRDFVTPEIERAFARAAERFVARAHTIAAASHTADPGAEPRLDIEAVLTARSRFYLLTLMTEASPSLAARVAEAFADRLLQANANRIANDLVERMIESRRGIEAALRKQLDATAAAAREAAARARSVLAAGARAVEDELKRLADLRAQLGPA